MLRRFLFALALLYPVAASAALPCSAYPNTLTNGTLADANQVMANFNNILNCVNSLAPLGIPVVGSSSNIKASLATAGTTITVTADTITVGTALNGTSYTLTSYSQSFNGATNGAGGMDTGALPTSGWVALYAIFNPVAPATSILGTNCVSACPTVYAGGNMPAGYTASALLTVLPTNATPAIAGGYVRGKIFTYGPNAQSAVVNVTTAHAVNTVVSLASFVPPNATTIYNTGILVCGTTPGGANVEGNIVSQSTDAFGSNEIAFNCASVNSAEDIAPFQPLLLVSPQTMYYENSVSGTSPIFQIVPIGYAIP